MMHSYSLVSEPSFPNLLQILEPRYNVPSRTTFSRSIIPDLYLREKAKVAETIRKDSKEIVGPPLLTHTAEALLDTLKAITDERSLPNILMFVVSDNAANMSCG